MAAWQHVSTHSIRYRILKVFALFVGMPDPQRFNPFDPIQDTESSRILFRAESVRCFNPFDPIQDTESRLVSSPVDPGLRRFNPFDPIQDTESIIELMNVWKPLTFQPIRSDTGY